MSAVSACLPRWVVLRSHSNVWHPFVSLNPGPDIWLEYTQYSIGGMASPGGIDRVRSVFERAVTAVGLHMTKGQMVWEAFREFENAILSTLQVGVLFFLLLKRFVLLFIIKHDKL